MSNINTIGTVTLTGPLVGTSSTAGAGNITTSTDRPYNLDNMNVSTGLRLNAINKKLQHEATLDSVFEDIGADVVYNGKKIMAPDACIMRLKTTTKGEHSQVIPLVRPLSGPGRGGVSEKQLGYERGLVLKYLKVYYNEFSQALASETWGMNYNELQLFDYYAELQPALSKWFAEDKDYQYHQALLESFAWPLQKAGVTNQTTGLTAAYNNNWYVPNSTTQPTWNATPATFLSSILSTMSGAATGTAGINANLDMDYLVALDEYAQKNLKITPVMVGGKKTYIFLCPNRQYRKLLLQTRSGNSVFTNVDNLSDEERVFPNAVGRVGSILLIEDQRYPTIVAGSSYTTLSATYCLPGNNDSRNTAIYAASNAAWDVGFLMGANALVDWTVTDLHFETDKTEYGKLVGKGAFTERGIQIGSVYTEDTAVTPLNFGSIVCPFTATTLQTIA